MAKKVIRRKEMPDLSALSNIAQQSTKETIEEEIIENEVAKPSEESATPTELGIIDVLSFNPVNDLKKDDGSKKLSGAASPATIYKEVYELYQTISDQAKIPLVRLMTNVLLKAALEDGDFIERAKKIEREREKKSISNII